MGFTWHPDANEHVELVLACDDDIQAANDEVTLAAYLNDGDASKLIVPAEGPTLFVIRPLTAPQLSSARRIAGRVSILGDRLLAEIREGERDADSLTDAEYESVELASEHAEAFRRAIVTMGLVSVHGWPEPDLSGIRSLVQRVAVETELQVHVLRLTMLGAEGNAPSV